MSEYIWQNGELKDFALATTHVMSHGLHYGTGVFEGIRAYEQADGSSAIFALEEHLSRIFFSAKALGMTVPYALEELKAATVKVVNKNQAKSCYIRPLVYYGLPTSKVRIRPAVNAPVEVVIYSYDMGNYLPDQPLKVKISKFMRLHPNSTNVEAKICGHYVNSLQALLEIDNTHYDEVLLLDEQGYVAEGSSENIFIVKDQVIYTPKLGTILSGITRKVIIELARDLGFEVVEKDIQPEELFTADEIFFTGTAVEVRAGGEINDIKIGNGQEGVITQQIKAEYKKIYQGLNPKYQRLLTKVMDI